MKKEKPEGGSVNKEIPLNEVSLHDTVADCWMVLFNRVYNLTSFLHKHPGGLEVMLECGGRDATLQFYTAGHRDFNWNSLLAEYLVGELPEHEHLPHLNL